MDCVLIIAESENSEPGDGKEGGASREAFFLSVLISSEVKWYMPGILALRGRGKGNGEFRASLSYTGTLRLAWTT